MSGPEARTYFSMLSGDGKLWIFGGFGDRKKIFNDLHFFDPGTGNWRQVKGTNPPDPRYLHASVLHEGILYIHGGSVSGKGISRGRIPESKELIAFDTSSSGKKKWTQVLTVGATPTARYGHAMASWGNSIVLAGGCKKNSEYMSDCYSLNPVTRRWTKLPDLPEKMAYHTLFSNGNSIYIFAGFNGSKNLNSLYRLRRGSTIWDEVVTIGGKPSARCGCSVQIFGDAAYFFGGYANNGHDNELYKLEIETRSWSRVKVTGTKPVKRAYLQSGTCHGKMYVFGGFNGQTCIADFKRITVEGKAPGKLNIRKQLINITPKQAANAVLTHYNSTDSLRREDLENILALIQKELKATPVAKIVPPSIPTSIPVLSNQVDTTGFTLKELEMLDTAVGMGLGKAKVVRVMRIRKKKRGEIKDVNRLIEDVFAAPDEEPQTSSITSAVKPADTKSTSDPGEPPDDLTCPLSLELFEDPVITDDGHTYERSNIEDWFRRTSTSPKTNLTLKSLRLRPNHVVKSIVSAWKKGELSQ